VTKVKPVTNIAKDVRPISPTPALSKLAEDLVVSKYIDPLFLESIDHNQFGAIPSFSNLHALVSMVHTWAHATDGTSSAGARGVLGLQKGLRPGRSWHSSCQNFGRIARWVCDFLMNRRQRVKLSSDCFSQWGTVPPGVPQGTKLGPWLFILMINDLRTPRSDVYIKCFLNSFNFPEAC